MGPDSPKTGTHFLKGLSPRIKAVEVIIHELSQSDVPVLIMGEHGTGKHTIARQIHETSCGTSAPFELLHCATLTEESFPSENGSVHGTIFLQEVGTLNPGCQRKLLENLSRQTSGETKMKRVICGSARDLESEARSGRFSEDLYYRISGVCLRLPPLRQRKEDISNLMNLFLAKFSKDFGVATPVLSSQTLELFNEYAWPGNISELADAAKVIVAAGSESLAMGGLRAILTKSENKSEPADDGLRVSLKEAARKASREAEKELILKALTRTRWNRRKAAEELQISYKALLYKLKQIGYPEYEAS